MANNRTIEHVFTATGVSRSERFRGPGSMLISGGVATVALERSWDNGATFEAVATEAGPPVVLASFGITAILPVNLDLGKNSRNLKYRFNCTAYTSGNIVCKLGV